MKPITRLLMAGLLVVACACIATEDTEPVMTEAVDAQDLIHVTSDPDSIGPVCTQCL